MTIAERFGAEQYCYLTTTGRVTGLPREIEIWFAARGNAIYMLAGSGVNSHWVMNILQQPRVRVRIDDEEFAGAGRVVESDEEASAVRPLLAAKYQDWTPDRPLSAWARTALPVAIDLDAEPVAS